MLPGFRASKKACPETTISKQLLHLQSPEPLLQALTQAHFMWPVTSAGTSATVLLQDAQGEKGQQQIWDENNKSLSQCGLRTMWHENHLGTC